jgi:hypothetical protein
VMTNTALWFATLLAPRLLTHPGSQRVVFGPTVRDHERCCLVRCRMDYTNGITNVTCRCRCIVRDATFVNACMWYHAINAGRTDASHQQRHYLVATLDRFA